CAMAPRRGRIATTDIPASARRGAAAGPRAPATGAAAVVLAAAPAKPAAAAAAAALVSIARSEREAMARMKTIYFKDLPLGRILFLAAVLAVVATLLEAAPPPSQRTFATPREAIQATIDAAEQNDTAVLLQIFGPAGKDIVESGDPAQDKDHRAEFASSAHEKLLIEEDLYTPDRVTFSVGTDRSEERRVGK